MLKLVQCEFAKLKRKKIIPLVFLSAFLFPIPITFLMATPRMLEKYPNKSVLFDGLFNMVMGYGVIFLLPCIIGVIAAMLFFMERDNDTFKNLRTIPVTSTQMIMAKIIVLFIFGVIFCLASMLATIVCGSFSMEVHGLTYKLLVAVELGIFITAGTLPIIVLVVFFSKTYIFSILLCVFYSVVSLTVETLFGTLPKWLCWLMPIPLTTLWGAGDMVKHGFPLNVNALEAIIPSTFQTVIILGIMAVASISLIDFLYKKRGILLMLLSVGITLFASTALDGTVWTFPHLVERVIQNNTTTIFPMCITLIAGYIIAREKSDDTLKSIMTIPVSYPALIGGKLIVCGFLSVFLGMASTFFTVAAELLVGFPGFSVTAVIQALIQITLNTLFLYIAVTPIIAFTARIPNGHMIGVILAFVYGYGGMFAAGNMSLANLYPITASMGLIQYRSHDAAVHWNIGLCSLSMIVVLLISVAIVVTTKNVSSAKVVKKPKKTALKKGW